MNDLADRPAPALADRDEARTLACTHGSAWAGDGQGLLLDLADALSPAKVL